MFDERFDQNDLYTGDDRPDEETAAEDLLNSAAKEAGEESTGEARDKSADGSFGDLPEETAETAPENGAQDAENKNGQEKNAGSDGGEKGKKEEKGTVGSFFYDIFELFAMSLSIVMILLTLFGRYSPVEGRSMNPTLTGSEDGAKTEDVLLISNLFYTPKRGDIVVIQTPTIYSSAKKSLDHAIVKRIIAVGGDTLTVDTEAWSVQINGEYTEEGRQSKPYILYTENDMTGLRQTAINQMLSTPGCEVTAESSTVFTVKIPEGSVFVMGDNRSNSKDSRSIGLIDERWIVGRALLRIYPFNRISTVK